MTPELCETSLVAHVCLEVTAAGYAREATPCVFQHVTWPIRFCEKLCHTVSPSITVLSRKFKQQQKASAHTQGFKRK